jgi:hypothetical protein
MTIAAGNMPETFNLSDNSTETSALDPNEPLSAPPLFFLPPHISDNSHALPYSGSSSDPLGKVPTKAEILEEIEGQARMADKVKEAELKMASNAKV